MIELVKKTHADLTQRVQELAAEVARLTAELRQKELDLVANRGAVDVLAQLLSAKTADQSVL